MPENPQEENQPTTEELRRLGSKLACFYGYAGVLGRFFISSFITGYRDFENSRVQTAPLAEGMSLPEGYKAGVRCAEVVCFSEVKIAVDDMTRRLPC